MAAEFDVAGRLAEGFVAVDDMQTYVWACAVRGYRHPDLTLHGGQVRDWYGTEDGLDLRALDADCAALRTMAQQVADASQLVRAQTGVVAAAWAGEGGSAAGDFLRRHDAQAVQLTAAVGAAAQSCQRLRDDLWRIVNGKVDSTVAADGRAQGQRSAWLAAARTLTTGGEVSEEAAAVVDSEIKPFVDSVIGGDWVADMRAAVSAVNAAYRAAVDAVAGRPPARFDIPAELYAPLAPRAAGAAPGTSGAAVHTAPVTSAPEVPAAPPPTPAPLTSPSATVPTNYAVPQPSPAETMAAPAAMVPPGGPASAPADPGAGLGALPGRFADALGGLLGTGSAALGDQAALPEPPELPDLESEPDLEPDPEPEDEAEDEPEDEPEDEVEDEVEAEPVEEDSAQQAGESDGAEPGEDLPAEEPQPDCPDSTQPRAEAAEEPEPTPPELAPAVPPAADPAAVSTPCEIAADELPQVGQ
ncbi:hypothetical protein [Mycolicibacterium mengxianglii]|uniref:hypothetical protein n=1 Tax=Mycolicibacterium mengxianglii TaxID=2736649 RepID=UPI0018D1A4C3|nr:hypothetical protein [Mycolicibacterium mengxianglii]